jgi:hypothetical protein
MVAGGQLKRVGVGEYAIPAKAKKTAKKRKASK